MQEERNELTKIVFPAIRQLCATRGVTFIDVDLRWGITDEHNAEDHVLPICLSEIDRCRPFFIGILGGRYGWVPQSMPASLRAQYPWLNEYGDRSVTELEMLHGVLNDPARCAHAYFYVRHPDYAPEAADTDGDRKDRLVDLRQRIRASGAQVREDYPTPQVLAGLVLADLVALVEELFPARPGEPYEHEREAFAARRTMTLVGRDDDLQRLDAHAAGTGGGLAVIGEAGIGKTSLLSRWVDDYRTAHPEQHLLAFSHDGAGEGNWVGVALEILGELQRRFNLPGAIPESEVCVRALFSQWLCEVAPKHGLVLVLDGLDELEDPADDRELAWFPDPLPPGLRLVISAAAGDTVAAAQRRNWGQWTLRPLPVESRRELILRYLQHYGKRLSAERVERIATAEQAASPLYLCTLLDELRLHGGHETLDELIDHHLQAATVPALMEQLLARYERDYDRARPGLVRDLLSLLCAARYGLTHHDLLRLMGTEDEPLAHEHIAHLLIVLDHWFGYRRNVGVTLGYEHVRRAVAQRYLSGEGERGAVHRRIARHCLSGYLPFLRVIQELPWQLEQAGAWAQLYHLLSSLTFIGSLLEYDRFEVKRLWAALERNSAFSMEEAYSDVADNAEPEQAGVLSDVAALLGQTGRLHVARPIFEWLLEHHRQAGNTREMLVASYHLGLTKMMVGDVAGALALHRENERLFREHQFVEGLILSLQAQAELLRQLHQFEQALALLQEHAALCESIGDMDRLGAGYGVAAEVAHEFGDLERALALWQEREQICRANGNMEGLGVSLHGQANIQLEWENFAEAEQLLAQHEQICRGLGNWPDVARNLQSRIALLEQQGKFEEVIAVVLELGRVMMLVSGV